MRTADRKQRTKNGGAEAAAVAKAKKPVSLASRFGHPVDLSSRAGNVTRGDVSVRVAWDSGTITLGEASQRIVMLDGLYSELLAAIPSAGDEYSEFAGMTCTGAVLSPRKGGLGRLIFTLVPTVSWAGTIGSDTLRVKWEIDMARYDRPILTHPKLNLEESDMGVHLQRWMEADPAVKILMSYPVAGGTTALLTEDEQKWAQKILKGVESYAVFAPVVTKISTCRGRPQTQKCGVRDTPAETVSGYEFLKTGDRSVQNDDESWTRTEQWTGSDTWDEDIYD